MTALRVLVLDDSFVCRSQLRSFLEADGDISVVGEAENGDNVLNLIEQTGPQLLVVDLQMPRIDGHQTITTVMAHSPLPILVVTSQPLGEGKAVVFESIRRGALELAEKPSALDPPAQKRLRETVRRLATIPVVRHVAGRLQQRPERIPPAPRSVRPPHPATIGPLIIGIASSAGGPLPLATLLSELPRPFPAAIAVVQHLPPGFFSAFAEFIQSRTRLRVKEVTGPLPLEAGTIYLPSRDQHIRLTDASTIAEQVSTSLQGYRPSADTLFSSIARHAHSRGAGVVLSGIGQDGTAGLLEMRRAGGLCLAQDRNSCAVWGMPKSALEAGAAERSLPPLGLAALLTDWAQLNQTFRHRHE